MSNLRDSRIMAPRGTATEVFTKFESNGWPATGLACLVGLNGPVPYLSGADASVHLAEELKNSAWRLPRSMVLTAITNYITSFVIVGRLLIPPCGLVARLTSLSHSHVLSRRYRRCHRGAGWATIYRSHPQCDWLCRCCQGSNLRGSHSDHLMLH